MAKPSVSIEKLQRIAVTYTEAAIRGDAPTLAVATGFGVPHPTACKWVAKCRDAGLLGPASHGRPSVPRAHRRLIAVAERIGVQPEALRVAIIECGNGRLAVSR